MNAGSRHKRTAAPSAPEETEGWPKRWRVFGLVAIGVFMSTLDSSIVNVALPSIMADFETALTVIEWVPMIYLLTVSSLLLTFGRLSDIHGRRRVYCTGFCVFSLGSLLCGTAGSAAWLIGARAFQGAGAAMLMACSPALVVDAFPLKERGRALGMVGTVVAAGLTTGPALGGLILKVSQWPLIFFINIPIGIAAAAVAIRVLPQSEPKREPLDLAGALLLAVCLTSLLAGLSHSHGWGLASWKTGGLLGLGVASGLTLAVVETRVAYPIFDPALLRLRLFTLPVISAVVLFASLFAITFLMPFYLVHPAGYPMERVGGILMVPFVFLFFISPLSGSLSDRIGSRVLCTLGMAVLAAALLLLSRLSAAAATLDIVWRLALAGVGIAIFISPNSAAAMSAVPPHRRGIASGAVATARNLGMVLGIAVTGLIFNATFRRLSGEPSLQAYRPELEAPFMAAFRSAMVAGAMVAAIGIVVAYLRGRPAPPPSSRPSDPA
jgi:EmrB/QacA subfamily drug resistance transporter